MKVKVSKLFVITVLLWTYIITGCNKGIKNDSDFVRIGFNNPGLEVDLAVGLWAWPLPVDYDKDGDMDLLVNCPDKPFNGLWFFENPDGSQFPVFKAPIRVEKGVKNIQISYTDNTYRVLTPGIEYLHFTDTLFKEPDTLVKNISFDLGFKKIRANQWKLADYESDGDLDIIVGIGDWTVEGQDYAVNEQ